MSNEIFKEMIQKMYNFKDNKEEKEETKKCEICGEEIGDFNDNGIYEGKYCEDCFNEAQEGRL